MGVWSEVLPESNGNFPRFSSLIAPTAGLRVRKAHGQEQYHYNSLDVKSNRNGLRVGSWPEEPALRVQTVLTRFAHSLFRGH